MIERFDFHTIRINSIYDDGLSEGGLIKLNSAWYRTEKELDRYERKSLSGVIESVPIGYTDKDFMPIDPGYPNPRIFIGHDIIQAKINKGFDWGNDKYHAGLLDAIQWEKLAEYGNKIDAKVGERVYFHPAVTESENLLEEGVYRAAVHEIIAIVEEDGNMRPQGGYVLVYPKMDNTTQSETGIIFRSEGEATMLEGTVAFARLGADVVQGDEILFQIEANYIIVIDGVEYYAMREDEVFMKKMSPIL